MLCLYSNFNAFCTIFLIILQIHTCWLQTNFQRSQRKAVDPNAQKFTATIICLHGLGDTGNSCRTAYDSIKESYVKLISPTASIQPVSILNGTKISAWFDITGLDQVHIEDTVSLEKSTRRVHELIQKETDLGIPTSRIVIAGFSQGAALALYSALTYAKPLAGIVALSGWIPLSVLNSTKVTTNRNIAIFQGHGSLDVIVPYTFAEMTAFLLRGLTSKLYFRTYHGVGHNVSPKEMLDVKMFLAVRLPQFQAYQTHQTRTWG